MNYYFFLDGSNKFGSSVELFNKPSCQHFNNGNNLDKNIYAVYSDNQSWNYLNLGILEKNKSKIIKKSDLPEDFRNESVFIFMSDKLINNFDTLPILKNEMKTTPEWRSNIKVYNDNTSTSYQGELPDVFLDKKLSLISCSPMIQNKINIFNYLFFINLRNDPKKINFKIELLNSNKKVLGEYQATTNTINYFNLNKFISGSKDLVYIIRSAQYGGIPIYFSYNNDESKLSLEHTHPPSSYIVFGDIMSFQKKKKIFWK
tara:strand:- start:18193 stop:18969 length:777 start_codon:yes stop_codon:yes gene_type:complete